MTALPSNVRAERGLLGVLLNHNDVIHDIPDLAKADFMDAGNGELFILFHDLITLGRGVTSVSILPDAQALAYVWGETKVSQYLADLERDAPATDPVKYAKAFAAAILNAAVNRRTYIALTEHAERILAAPESIPAAVLRDDLDTTITALFSSSSDLGLEDVAEVGDRLLGRLKDTDVEIGRALGLAFIQNLMGPALPGRLILLGGSSGAGKSGLLAQIAIYDAKQGGVPLLFTREMRTEEVASRLLAADTEIKSGQIERNMLNAAEYQKLWDANEAMRGLRFKLSSPSKFSVPYIRARAQRQQKVGGLTLVEIDHVHLLAKFDRRMSDGEAMNENLEGLKLMAMDLGVPVIAACQLTGEALKDLNKWPHRLPIFTDLLYSAAIDRNADIVLIIHRLEHVLRRNRPQKDDDPKRFGEWETKLLQVEGMVEAILTKRRSGGEGEGQRTGYFDRQRVLFSDSPFRPVWKPDQDQRDLMAMFP